MKFFKYRGRKFFFFELRKPIEYFLNVRHVILSLNSELENTIDNHCHPSLSTLNIFSLNFDFVHFINFVQFEICLIFGFNSMRFAIF